MLPLTAFAADGLRDRQSEAWAAHRLRIRATGRFACSRAGRRWKSSLRDRNYANVRLPDGTAGYVKAAYLVDEKPAKLIVAETMAERDALRAELEETKQAFAGPAATIQGLKDEAADLSSKLETAQEEIDTLKEENADIQGMKERYKGSLPLSWVGGATGVCLVVGFLLGLWWVDYRSRKRHGGIRIY